MSLADRIKKPAIELIRRLGYEVVPTRRVMPRDIAGHLKTLFELLDITCVFDVGANIGQYGQLLRDEVGFRGWIVSFEPGAHAASMLREKSRGDERWLVQEYALGSEDAVRRLNVMSADTLSSFLAPDNSTTKLFAQYNAVDHTEDVKVRTLDTALEELRGQHDLGQGLFLKMDTQGFDLEVMRGAERSLPLFAALQTELSCQKIYERMPGYVEMLQELDKRGFQWSGLFPVNQDTRLRLIEADCVMVNAAHSGTEDARLMWTNTL